MAKEKSVDEMSAKERDDHFRRAREESAKEMAEAVPTPSQEELDEARVKTVREVDAPRLVTGNDRDRGDRQPVQPARVTTTDRK